MSVDLQQLRPGEIFATRYQVLRLIRAGGMGAVYEVEDTATRRRRALKLMHPVLVASAESRMRFQREVFIGAELDTEHVVEVIDAGLDAPMAAPYFTMELLRGEELGDRLERVKRLPADEVLAILAQVARVLDKAHSKGIVHRDLKPENVFLTVREDGSLRVKVLDFGIAKLVAGAESVITQATGTPLYMAPEQTESGGKISGATDVWAFGLLAYRMLVGKSYWHGENLNQLYREVLVDTLGSAEQRALEAGVALPTGFDAWFFRCVARSPEQRFRASGEAIQQLAQLFRRPLDGAPRPWPLANDGAPIANGQLSSLGHQPTVFVPARPEVDPGGAAVGRAGGPGTPTFGSTVPLEVLASMSPSMAAQPSKGTSFGAAWPWVGSLLLLAGVLFHFLRGPSVAPPTVAGAALTAASLADEARPKVPSAARSALLSAPSAEDVQQSFVEAVTRLNPFLTIPGRSLAMQTHEVTREEFAWFLRSRQQLGLPLVLPLEDFTGLLPSAAAPAPSDVDGARRPVTWVTFETASAHCAALGARLPTAAEWDAAVTGKDGRTYPWGSAWPAPSALRQVAVGRGREAMPLEVGSSSFDRGPFGHVDLVGNVQEWTATGGAGGKTKLLRGGDVAHEQRQFLDPGELFSEAAAPPQAVNAAKADGRLGFRCVR